MSARQKISICMLGCGNLGSALLDNLIKYEAPGDATGLELVKLTACVRSEETQTRLEKRFQGNSDRLSVCRGSNVNAIKEANVTILAVDPADVVEVLSEPGVQHALQNQKLLISIAAGWSRQKLEATIYGSATTRENQHERVPVLRVLPNIAALVKESLTAIEISQPALSNEQISLAEQILGQLGQTARVPAQLMDATTAVSGSTPAFWAIICDALIDASVAVGVPRDLARTMIVQSMKGTATMIQNGNHPSLLKDQGTSPEGCTIGGLMVLEEAGVRGSVGKALREAVTISRLMETTEHLNDTRRPHS